MQYSLSLSLSFFVSYIAKESAATEENFVRFHERCLEIVKPKFLESVHVPRVFFTRSSMILLCWAALQKSHGVKDIAMRHWGVLRSSVREVGYLVVSSPSTGNTFHSYACIWKEKKQARCAHLYPWQVIV